MEPRYIPLASHTKALTGMIAPLHTRNASCLVISTRLKVECRCCFENVAAIFEGTYLPMIITFPPPTPPRERYITRVHHPRPSPAYNTRVHHPRTTPAYNTRIHHPRPTPWVGMVHHLPNTTPIALVLRAYGFVPEYPLDPPN